MNNFNSLEISSSFKFDSRDNTGNPRHGFFLKLDCLYAPEFLDNRYNFFKAAIDTRLFFTLKTFINTTFALRVGGTKIWGKYPFFRAAFLGGSENLRGYSRYRFAGDASIFGQFEMRTNLGKIYLIFPSEFGFHIFGDTGRVFWEEENSNNWHYDYGGGLWISFAQRRLTTSFTLAKSPEKLALYFSLKLMY